MARRDLLPGVNADRCPPAVVFQSRRFISRARRRALLRDAAQLVLVAGVDYLFVNWPSSHIPTMTRGGSAVLLVAVNGAIAAQAYLSRMIPRWTARRIARTWCLAERARFFAALRNEQPRK